MSDIDQNLFNTKLKEVIELASDSAISSSKQNHRIFELQKENKDLKECIDECEKSNEELKISVARMDEKIENIKNGMMKVDKRFTITKIISLIVTIVTISAGAISTLLIILKHLGILK